jgi:hypothetical protein
MKDDKGFPALPPGFSPSAEQPAETSPQNDYPALPPGFTAPAGETMDTGQTDYTVTDPEAAPGTIKPEDMAAMERELNAVNSNPHLKMGQKLNEARRDCGKYNQHLQESDIRHAMSAPGRAFRIAPVTNEDFRQNASEHDHEVALQRKMQELGIDPNDPSIAGTLKRGAFGAVQSVRNIPENLAALGLDAMGKIGIIHQPTAYNAADLIRSDQADENEMAGRTNAGVAGRVVGDLGVAAVLPVAGRAAEGAEVLTGMQRLARFAKGTGTNMASGAVASLTAPSGSSEETAFHMGLGAAANAALVPAMEWLIGHGGQKAVASFNNVFGKGVGRELVTEQGALTPFARVLAARLRGQHPGMPDRMIEDAIRGLSHQNPANMPADRAVVGEGLSHAENVPLTGGEKSGDVARVQNYESAKAGSLGGATSQTEAIAAEKGSSDALLSNVESIGSGQSAGDAAHNAADILHGKATDAQAAVDTKYDRLRRSAEPLTPQGQAALKTNIHDALDATGQGGVDIMSGEAKSLARRLNSLANSKKPPRFGQVWALSREIKDKARATFGRPESVDIKRIGDALDHWLASAKGTHFAGGDAGVARTLEQANSEYKALNDQYGARPTRTRGGGKLADPSGKSVANIVALVRQTSPDGVRAGQDISADVERQIFGSGKGFSEQAANTVSHIAQVAPEAVPHLRDIYVSRLVREITENTPQNIPMVKPGTMAKVIHDTIQNNVAGLRALGITPAQITSLENNAYLASLKILPPGARNVGSGKFIRGLAKGLRYTITRTLVAALSAGEAAHAGASGAESALAAAAGFAGAEAAARGMERGVAKRAISGKVPLADNAGKKVGKILGRKAGTALSIPLSEIGGN